MHFRVIQTNSLIKFHWSKFINRCNEFIDVIETNLLKQTKRNETKREFLDYVENVTNLKFENFEYDFEWLFVDLMIWLLNCCKWFFFYQTMFQRFKKMNIVKIIWWRNWLIRKQKNRLLIEYRLISTNKKIDYWHVSKIRKRKSTIDKSSFSQIYNHYRWFTIIFANSRCVKWK